MTGNPEQTVPPLSASQAAEELRQTLIDAKLEIQGLRYELAVAKADLAEARQALRDRTTEKAGAVRALEELEDRYRDVVAHDSEAVAMFKAAEADIKQLTEALAVVEAARRQRDELEGIVFGCHCSAPYTECSHDEPLLKALERVTRQRDERPAGRVVGRGGLTAITDDTAMAAIHFEGDRPAPGTPIVVLADDSAQTPEHWGGAVADAILREPNDDSGPPVEDKLPELMQNLHDSVEAAKAARKRHPQPADDSGEGE